MGLVVFLRFSLLCFDFLAWPALALGYPLWASIRAIETSSKHHMRKLVTYWTIFSLISLFEIFFVKLIQWVPFWPYVKLVAICCLVIPKFNGACYVYQCLVHPCLSVKPQGITNWLCIPKENAFSEESFLASAETYLKENGTEALQKLIASEAKFKEHVLTDADALEVVRGVEPIEKNVTAEEQLVEHPKPHLVDSEKEIAAAEAQRLTTPAKSEEKRPLEIHDVEKVQREWTCAMCQVTTPSEAMLNSHLLGRKHRFKCKELKASTQTTKDVQSSAAKHKSETEELKTSRRRRRSKSENLKTSTQTTKDMQSSAAEHDSKSEELKTSTQTSNNLKLSPVKTNDSNQAKQNLGSKQNTTEKSKSTDINAARGKPMQEKPKNKNAGGVNKQSILWCGICNIGCPEIDMISHLKGRRHLHQMQSRINPVGGGQA